MFFGDFDKLNDDEKPDDKLNKLFNMLFNFSESGGIKKDLGKPDSEETLTEDGVKFIKKIYKTEYGTIIKYEMIGYNDDVDYLESQLKLAVEEERFEDAAKLRDRIKNKKGLVINQEINDNDEDNWNF